MKIIIDIDTKGNTKVSGFPSNYPAAMQMMQGATNAVCNLFIEKARAGLLDETGTIQEPKASRIIKLH